MSSRTIYICTTILRSLLIGLLIHFLAYNFVTFTLDLQGGMWNMIWMRKEIGVGLLCMIIGYHIWKSKPLFLKPTLDGGYLHIIQDPSFQYIIWIVLFITLLWSIVSAFFNQTTINTYILALRYDFMGFVVGCICIFLSQYLSRRQIQSFFTGYGAIIKVVIVIGLGWYMILMIKPGILKLFGYTTKIYEAEIGKQPPAVYYTQQFQGYPRNQFFFERPIHYGFWLTMMWPLFFVLYLKRRSWDKTGFRRIIYGLNVMTTFSRAARGVWIIETFILALYTYRSNVGFYLKKMFIPLIGIVLILIGFGYSQIVDRDFSNTGHLQLFIKGLEYAGQHRVVGLGPGSVGPASYHHGGLEFNPENQFLQILIEFGIVGFIGRMTVYLFFAGFGLRHGHASSSKKKNSLDPGGLIFAMSLGMCGLAISGMVLHSFVDRMIVIPMMIITGLAMGYRWYHHSSS